MLRNFLSQSIQVLSASRPLAKSIHTSQLRFQQSNVEDENEPYQTDRSNGIKNLEKLGIAKPHWSWPKYNRTIFPPTEDGVPLMNPVRFIFFSSVFNQSEIITHVYFSLSTIKETSLSTRRKNSGTPLFWLVIKQSSLNTAKIKQPFPLV
jgi:hypothetical protein